MSDCITLTNNRMFIWYSQEVIFLQQNGQPLILVGNPNVELVKNKTGDITGISLNDPCEKRITIPVKPGRNLAVILEIAARNNRLKRMGYNAAQTFNENLMKRLSEEG